MAILKLPRLPVNWKDQPQLFERYWDDLCRQLEKTLNAILDIPGIQAAIASTATILATKADKGANSDITSLGGLTTPLSISQGGTNATTSAGALTSLGAAPSGSYFPYSTDSGIMITGSNIQRMIYWNGALTANRNLTLTATGQTYGYVTRVTNVTTGGFNVLVKNLTTGGTTLATLATAKYADFVWDGTNWFLVASGSVSTTP